MTAPTTTTSLLDELMRNYRLELAAHRGDHAATAECAALTMALAAQMSPHLTGLILLAAAARIVELEDATSKPAPTPPAQQRDCCPTLGGEPHTEGCPER